MKRELVDLDVAEITVKRQLREQMGDLTTLENSIRKIGLLSPVVVDRNNVLVAGSRRLQACRNLGLQRIPAFRMDGEADSMAALEVQTDENLCRMPLSSEDLECLIQLKKSSLGSSQRSDAGLISRFKNMFSREADAKQG